ncbi:MAG: PhoH family protein [Pseudomonadota bacterium]
MTKKIYALDTNVLVHDPNAPLKFKDNDVVISMTVLEELDHLKSSRQPVAAESRQAIRMIDSLLYGSSPEELSFGVPIKHENGEFSGGVLSVLLPPNRPEKWAVSLPKYGNDNIIINELLRVKEKTPDAKVVLVSKDINMRLKARACGLIAEDYQNDQLIARLEHLTKGYYLEPGSVWDCFSEVKSQQVNGQMIYHVPVENMPKPTVNEYVVDSEGFVGRVIAKSETTLSLKHISRTFLEHRQAWGLRPRNIEQALALDLLLDPDIHHVCITGPAGSGKTILAVAAALEMTGELSMYRRIIVTRSTPSLAEDIGFLPGTEQEKMDPWLGGIADNIEALHKEDENLSGSIDYLLEKIPIQFKSMNYIRGRSFQNSLILIDESQNLSPHQMKTMITRAGGGSKVVCLGNLSQIDTPYLNPTSSGLTYLTQRFRGFIRSGSIQLKGVPRSELAAYAEREL